MNKKQIYLSKDGKTTGPVTSEQLVLMYQKGELANFTWLWSVELEKWVKVSEYRPAVTQSLPPQAPPPRAPAPLESSGPPPLESGPPPLSNTPPSLQGAEAGTVSLALFRGICHDNQHLVEGKISRLSRSGCTFTNVKPIDLRPVFRKGSRLALNLLNISSGKSENIPATVEKMTQKPSAWEYELKWDRIPILLENLVS